MSKGKILANTFTFLIGVALLTVGFLSSKQRDININIAQTQIQEEIDVLHEEAKAWVHDTIRLLKILGNETLQEKTLNELSCLPFSILIYKGPKLVFWSSNQLIPVNIRRLFRNKYTFIKYDNGYYSIYKNKLSNNHIVVALIPIYYTYDIENRYLKSGFSFGKKLEHIKISNDEQDRVIETLENEPLFYIKENTDASIHGHHEIKWWNWGLIFVGLTFMLYGLGKLLVLIYLNGLRGLAILIGISFIIILDLLIRKVNYDISFFSPSLYASKYWGKTLAQLLLRGILFAWTTLIVFAVLKKNKSNINRDIENRSIISLFQFILSNGIIVVLFTVAGLITESLVKNSTISFDFNNFYTLDIHSFFKFINYKSILFVFFCAILHSI